MSKKKDFTHWLVVIPHPEGDFEDSEGNRVNIHRFPKKNTVNTKFEKHKGTTKKAFAEEHGYRKLISESALPDNMPHLEYLDGDSRFSTIESLLDNKDQLTDIDGIGPARAEEIINHITKIKNEGE